MGSRLDIFTHHKCASTWLTRYVNEFCSLNSMTLFATHYSNLQPSERADIAVFSNSSYEFVCNHDMSGVHIIRNPLDIVVSAYYSHKKTHAVDGWPELVKQREAISSINEKDGLFLTLAFLERDDFYRGAIGPLCALRHWNFDDERFTTLRMEDLVSDPNMVGSILKSKFSGCVLPSAHNHTFEAVAGRSIGRVDNNSHYRSGKVDQWRDVLPEPIVNYIRLHLYSILEKFYPESLSDRAGGNISELMNIAPAFRSLLNKF